VEIMSTVFADDVSLYQSTGEGVQQVMDGVLLFCGAMWTKRGGSH
jgi:hypothetical protein